jgi:hypothetical protein
MTPCRDGDHS